jgi:hypothetical protein
LIKFDALLFRLLTIAETFFDAAKNLLCKSKILAVLRKVAIAKISVI